MFDLSCTKVDSQTPSLLSSHGGGFPSLLHMGRVSNYKCMNLGSHFQWAKQLIYLLGFNFQCMSSMYTIIHTPNSHGADKSLNGRRLEEKPEKHRVSWVNRNCKIRVFQIYFGKPISRPH